MAEDVSTPSEETLRQAGELIAARQEGTPQPLGEGQRTAVQDATLAIVRGLREGKTVATIEQGLIEAGWKAPVAVGFVRLVSQMLSRMYLVRMGIFAGLTLVTGMLASVVASMAWHGEFSWLEAGIVVLVTVVCLSAMLRNLQLWRKFRLTNST